MRHISKLHIMRNLFLLITVISLGSCTFFGGERVSGNGKVITEDRQVGSFEDIQVSGGIDVQIKQDPSQRISISTDENLMPLIEVYVSNNTLHIREQKGYNLDPSNELIVYINAAGFNEIDVSGSSDLSSANRISVNNPLEISISGSANIDMDIDAPSISTDVSGSGTVKLRGRAKYTRISLSGSGDIKCFDLASENVELDVSGSADAEVSASSNLDVSVSGAGTVNYRGNPSVKQSISGAGSVKKVG